MHPLVYLSAHAFSLLAAWSIHQGGIWLFSFPIVAYVIFPFLEIFYLGTEDNERAVDAEGRLASLFQKSIIWLMVPNILCLVAFGLYRAATADFLFWEYIGLIATLGSLLGVFGINLAHEMGHRRDEWNRFLSKTLLLSTLYMHFYIEHNYGHHANVATDKDPASSRRGQTLYAFWLQSIVGGYKSAWNIENRRLISRTDRPAFSLSNQMLRYQFIQTSCLLGVLFLLGPLALLIWVASSLWSILLLETVNYIEHYGLRRKINAKGRAERTAPRHSWNSNASFGRALLFDLTRHSDHHANPTRPHHQLRHFEESPQLPAGYAAMIILAGFPPLWFKIMDKTLDSELARLDSIAA